MGQTQNVHGVSVPHVCQRFDAPLPIRFMDGCYSVPCTVRLSTRTDNTPHATCRRTGLHESSNHELHSCISGGAQCSLFTLTWLVRGATMACDADVEGHHEYASSCLTHGCRSHAFVQEHRRRRQCQSWQQYSQSSLRFYPRDNLTTSSWFVDLTCSFFVLKRHPGVVDWLHTIVTLARVRRGRGDSQDSILHKATSATVGRRALANTPKASLLSFRHVHYHHRYPSRLKAAEL